MRYSDSYKFTVNSREDQRVKDLRRKCRLLNLYERAKELVEESNSSYKTRYKIRVRGRLGQNSPYKSLYAVGGSLYRMSAQDIRPEHSARFDVYMAANRVWK